METANAICVVLLEKTLSWKGAGAEWKQLGLSLEMMEFTGTVVLEFIHTERLYCEDNARSSLISMQALRVKKMERV